MEGKSGREMTDVANTDIANTDIANLVGRRGALAVLFAAEILVAVATVLAVAVQPAVAQADGSFRFPFPFFQHRPQSQPFWQWQQQPAPQQAESRAPQIDYSRAPSPRRPDTSPTTHVVVMGDATADWLAYGLEDAFADTPEIGVVRKHHTYSGLIHSESRSAYDWPQAARDILATEKPDFIVMMIGLSDRQSIRERQVRPNPQAKPGTPQPATPQSAERQDQAAQRTGAPDDEGQPASDEPPAAAVPEPTARGGLSTYEFRSEKWAEVYSKRIDEMIAVLKSKGAPVFWVGLPALRGTRSTADMAYLNDLYRGRAEKAGIVFVDVWDGFVDESGNFTMQGPDFEGQTRRLRSADGVYFTKAGAQKLAHYVEREIRHAMLTHATPVATSPAPEEPQPQVATNHPGAPARPVAGPVVPLNALTGAQEGLLGGGPEHTLSVDQSASKLLVKGEPLPSLAGRADDFAWPRNDGAVPAATVGDEPPTEPALPAKATVTAPVVVTAPAATSPKAPARPIDGMSRPPKRVDRPSAAVVDRPVAHIQPPVTDDSLRPPGLVPTR